jgi:hypothetical protein
MREELLAKLEVAAANMQEGERELWRAVIDAIAPPSAQEQSNAAAQS